MYASIRKGVILLRNMVIWICPLVLLILSVGVAVYFFRGHFQNFLDVLTILIWPFTILSISFFFRKVFTYMFFSLNKFNFFGAQGSLTSVYEVINKEVEDRVSAEKEAQRQKDESDRITAEFKAKLHNESASATENLELAKEVFKTYKEYKQTSETRINDLQGEISLLREVISRSQIQTPSSPPPATETLSIGAGEQVKDLSNAVPLS